MNKNAPFLGLLGFSLAVFPSLAADLSGDNLLIGDDNVISYTWANEPAKSAVLGLSNSIDGIENLVVGEGNNLSYAILNLILGNSNSQVSNTINDTMLSVGHNNVFGGCGDTAIFGSSNYAAIGGGFLAGFGNSMTGSLQFGIGQGLINHADNGGLSLYLGQYNAAVQSSPPPLLVVGKGTGPSQRANALEIARDGKAKITNAVEIYAPNYNAANANSGKIVLQPSTSGSGMTIDGKAVLTASSNGNVGIGLSNPSHLLDLGAAYINSDGSALFTSGSFTNLEASESGLFSGTMLFAPSWSGVTYISGTGSPDNNTDFLNLGTGHGGLVIRDGDFNYDYVTVLGSGSSNPGHVGIGTSTPQALLTVNGNAALGVGLASAADQVVVGKYNDTRTNDAGVNHTQGVFIVGSGTSGSGANALRVLNDGTILVKKSGNLSMGSFTNGPRP